MSVLLWDVERVHDAQAMTPGVLRRRIPGEALSDPAEMPDVVMPEPEPGFGYSPPATPGTPPQHGNRGHAAVAALEDLETPLIQGS